MILKQFYGNTIAEARDEAKKELGNGAIVLETKNKVGTTPASVTVMAKSETPKPVPTPEPILTEPAYSRKAAVKKPAFAEVMKQARPFDEKERFDTLASPETINEPSLSRRGMSLYETGEEENETSIPNGNDRNNPNPEGSNDISSLTKRLEALETLMASSFLQSGTEYISHPAYQQLLKTGVPSGLIHSWFTTALEKGTDPFLDNDNFMIELGAAIQRALPSASTVPAKRIQVFMGSSGSGKSSLITKLSKNKQLLAGNKLAVVSINGPGTHSLSPLLRDSSGQQLFEYFEAATKAEIRELVKTLSDFEQVLVDTPSLSLQPEIAAQQINIIKPLLHELGDYELHHVVNATLNRAYFSEEYTNAYPIRPDFISLTHLDESLSSGHLLPLIRVSNGDVRYIGHGPSPFDDIRLYNQGWFAGKILALEEL